MGGTHRVQKAPLEEGLCHGVKDLGMKENEKAQRLASFKYWIEVCVGISSSSSEMPPESPNGQCPAETLHSESWPIPEAEWPAWTAQLDYFEGEKTSVN